MNRSSYLAEVRAHLARNEIRRATELLRSFLAETPLLTEVLQNEGRYTALLARLRTGTVPAEEATVTENQIRKGLLDLIDEIDRRRTGDAAVSREIERGLSVAAQNVFIGNTFHAPVHFHAGDAIPAALTAPPFQLETLLGRAEALADLHRLLVTEATPFLLVNGAGGVGKTALVAAYYAEYATAFTHRAWVTSERDITQALLPLALPLGLEFPDTLPTDQRLERLLAELARLPGPGLLVIDNVDDPADLARHYRLLRRCPNFRIVLTTRLREFDAPASFYPVDGLAEAAALDLFRSHYPAHRPAEDDLLRRFVADVDRNTLLIELFAKNLRKLNRLREKYRLADLLRDIEDSLLALSQSQTVAVAYQARGAGLRQEQPAAILLAMYDVGELTEAERKAISILAALPNEAIPFRLLDGFTADFPAEEPALALFQKGWVEFNEAAATFKVNPLVRDVVRVQQRDRLRADCREVREGVGFALADPELFQPRYRAYGALLLRYAAALTRAVPEPDFSLTFLYEKAGQYYRRIGNLPAAREVFELGYQNQLALHKAHPDRPQEPLRLAIGSQHLGSTYLALGQQQKGEEWLIHYLQMAEQLLQNAPDNAEYRETVATAHSHLGKLYHEQDRFEKAKTHFTAFLSLARGLAQAEPGNLRYREHLSTAHQQLGGNELSLEHPEPALRHFARSEAIIHELLRQAPDHVDYQDDLAHAAYQSGDAYHALGDRPQALASYQRFERLARELWEARPLQVGYQSSYAYAIAKLGVYNYVLDADKEQARASLRQARELWQAAQEAAPHNAEIRDKLAWADRTIAELR